MSSNIVRTQRRHRYYGRWKVNRWWLTEIKSIGIERLTYDNLSGETYTTYIGIDTSFCPTAGGTYVCFCLFGYAIHIQIKRCTCGSEECKKMPRIILQVLSPI